MPVGTLDTFVTHGAPANRSDTVNTVGLPIYARQISRPDGSASEAEYDALLDRLEILGGVDRDKIDELLTTVSNQVEATGFEPRIARLGELVSEKADASAALMLGLAIALADDEFQPEEREVANKVATALGLTGIDLDALVVEIRG